MLLYEQFVVVTQTIQTTSLLLMTLWQDLCFITYTENVLSAAAMKNVGSIVSFYSIFNWQKYVHVLAKYNFTAWF